jgi:hypothetical protein
MMRGLVRAIAQELYRLSREMGAAVVARVRASIAGTWRLIGCEQLRNALLFVGIVLCACSTQEMARIAMAVSAIAQAQRLVGYASVAQLQMTDQHSGTAAAVPGHHAAGVTIDPARLGLGAQNAPPASHAGGR